MAAKKRSKAKAGKRTPTSSVTVSSVTRSRAAGSGARAAKPSATKAKVSPQAASRSRAASASPSVPERAAKKAKKPAASKPAASKPAGAKASTSKAPAAAPATLSAGDRAPSFELPDQAGGSVSSESLGGHPYVLYFYPKDDTPGCTTEACGFRDAYPDLEAAGVRVIGVSPDSVASHQKFVGKYGLPFTLLSDTDRSLASAYGVWALKKLYGRESMGIVRSTFLVDGEGVIRKVWRGVRVNGHIADVQAAAAQLA